MSTLADVFVEIRDYYTAKGSDTTIKVGEQYLADNDSPNRIVLVPGKSKPEMAPMRMTENGFAKLDAQATAYIWGPANVDDDFARFVAVDSMLIMFLRSLWNAAPGRIMLLDIDRPTDTRILSYGEEYRVTFSFMYQVEDDVTPRQPMAPKTLAALITARQTG